MDPSIIARDAQADVHHAQVLKPIGQWALVWRRFRRHRFALLSVAALTILGGLALAAPSIAPPLLALPDYQHLNQPPRPWPLDVRFLFGTDTNGDPVLSYVLLGARATLTIGVLGAMLASLIGTIIGAISGYVAGVVDAAAMRIVDLFLAVPMLPLIILLGISGGESTVTAYVFYFGLAGWAGVARLVRAYALSLREREFVMAARALGAPTPRIITRHILPSALDVIVVSLTLNIAVFIITEATLEYLGLGPGAATWGHELALAYYSGSMLLGYWWEVAFPGAAVLISVLAVNFLGDALRDALDVTGSDALIAPARYRPPGPLRRALTYLSRMLFRPAGMIAAPAGRAASSFHARATAARRAPHHSPAEAAWTARAASVLAAIRLRPLWLRLLPLPLALAVTAPIVLLGHARLRYAPHYPAPTPLAAAYGDSEYGADARPDGGWSLLYIDTAGRVTYREVSGNGHTTLARIIAAHASEAAQPSLARSGNHILGSWVAASGEAIEAAFLDGSPIRPFAVSVPRGRVEHPDVVALPGGRFAILFSWQRASLTQLYLAEVGPSVRRTPSLRRIPTPGDYALYPRGVADGAGGLDLAYLARRRAGEWRIRFLRLSPTGRISQQKTLGNVLYSFQRSNGSVNLDVVPPRWPLDLQRAADGSVWIAWIDGQFVVQSNAPPDTSSLSASLSVARWDARGISILAPTLVDSYFNQVGWSLALAPSKNGGHVYFAYPAAVIFPRFASLGSLDYGTHDSTSSTSPLVDEGFDARGLISAFERITYAAGGDAATPRSATIRGRPHVIWQNVHARSATLESTVYRAARPPDLATRLGINLGNVWANLGLLFIAALGGGAILAVINALLLIALTLLWLIASLLARPLRWPAYCSALSAAIIAIFAARSSLPGWVLVIPSLGTPSSWIVAVAASIILAWSCAVLFHRLDAWFRAALTAFLGIYLITAMGALILIQTELQKI